MGINLKHRVICRNLSSGLARLAGSDAIGDKYSVRYGVTEDSYKLSLNMRLLAYCKYLIRR